MNQATKLILVIILLKSIQTFTITTIYTSSNPLVSRSRNCPNLMSTGKYMMGGAAYTNPYIVFNLKKTARTEDFIIGSDHHGLSLTFFGLLLPNNRLITAGEKGVRIIDYSNQGLLKQLDTTTTYAVYSLQKIFSTNFFIYHVHAIEEFKLVDYSTTAYTVTIISVSSYIYPCHNSFSHSPFSNNIYYVSGGIHMVDYSTKTDTNVFNQPSTVTGILYKSIEQGISKEKLLICTDKEILQLSTTDQTFIERNTISGGGCRSAKLIPETQIFYAYKVANNYDHIFFGKISDMTELLDYKMTEGYFNNLCFNPYNLLFAVYSRRPTGRFIIFKPEKSTTCTQTNCQECYFSSDNCSLCKAGYRVEDGNCVTSCSTGKFLDTFSNKCVWNCPEGLININGVCQISCSGPTPIFDGEKCVGSCPTEKKIQDGKFCVDECYLGIFSHSDGNCYQKCPDTFFANPGMIDCQACDPICENCNGSATACTSCKQGSSQPYLKGENCVQNCGAKFYLNTAGTKCFPCDSSCETCINGTECVTCPSSAPYLDATKKCIATCESNCKTCQTNSYECTSCLEGKYLDNNDKICKSCDSSCETCVNSAANCTSCSSTFKNPYRNPETNPHKFHPKF